MTVTEASLSRTPEVAPAGDRYPSTTSLVASFGELPGPARLAHQGAKGWRPGTHLLRYCPDGPLLTYPALSDAIAVRTMFTQGPEHHETEMAVVFSDEASASAFLTQVAQGQRGCATPSDDAARYTTIVQPVDVLDEGVTLGHIPEVQVDGQWKIMTGTFVTFARQGRTVVGSYTTVNPASRTGLSTKQQPIFNDRVEATARSVCVDGLC